MIFGVHPLRYSTRLLTLFTLAMIVTLVSLTGLILTPLYANEKIGIALYLGLAFGLGILALTIRRAQVVRDQRR